MIRSTFRSMKLLGALLLLAFFCGLSEPSAERFEDCSRGGQQGATARSSSTLRSRRSSKPSRNITTTISPGTAWVARRPARATGRRRPMRSPSPSSSTTNSRCIRCGTASRSTTRPSSTRDEDQAKKENKKPEEVQVDLSSVNFEKPMQHLQEAVKLNGEMWRAHYFLGKIYREQDKPKDAATEFSAAIKANPRESGPYVALGELYRKWDYTDEAIKVTSQGTVNVPGTNEVSDIWFVLGMGYDDKRMDDKAIEAFDKAIETKQGQPQGEVPARSGVLPQGRLHAREARPRGLLEDRRRVARVREAAGEQDADGHRGEVGRRFGARRPRRSRRPISSRRAPRALPRRSRSIRQRFVVDCVDVVGASDSDAPLCFRRPQGSARGRLFR